MKNLNNIKLGCKSCDPMLENDWINDSGFKVVLPNNNKVTNIVGPKNGKKSAKTVSLF